MNYYFFARLHSFFVKKIPFVTYMVILGLTFYFPFSMIINRYFNNLFTKYLYTIGSIWLGTLTIGIGLLICFEIIYFFVKFVFGKKISNKYLGLLMCVSIVGLSTYAFINAQTIVIKNISIPFQKLDKSYKIIYMSDIHIDSIHDMSYLQKIINKINDISADFVVINGDLVDGSSFGEKDFHILNQINKDVFFTYGNHEGFAGKQLVEKLLSQTKVKILKNNVYNYSGLQLIGLDDIRGFDNKINQELLDFTLSNIQIDKNIPSVLILHAPIGSEISAKHGIDLQLAGHTHNGQIFPFMYLVKFAYPYIKGLYKIENMYLYVSSGVGTWGPPMRLGSQSEIIVFELN